MIGFKNPRKKNIPQNMNNANEVVIIVTITIIVVFLFFIQLNSIVKYIFLCISLRERFQKIQGPKPPLQLRQHIALGGGGQMRQSLLPQRKRKHPILGRRYDMAERR